MKTIKYISILFLGMALIGCSTFKVKNTEGLRLAYEDIDLASSKAIELKSLKNIDNAQREEAADLYRQAKAKINSYLEQAITDAASYTVDKDKSGYVSTKASEKVKELQRKVSSFQGRAPASAVEWIPVAAKVIEEIVKLNDEHQKAAYERFTKTVKENMMMSYESLPNGDSRH